MYRRQNPLGISTFDPTDPVATFRMRLLDPEFERAIRRALTADRAGVGYALDWWLQVDLAKAKAIGLDKLGLATWEHDGAGMDGVGAMAIENDEAERAWESHNEY